MTAIIRVRTATGETVDIPAIVGPQGPAGPQGERGPQGEQGMGISYKDNVPAYANLPTSAELGDAYFVEADSLLYIYGENGFPSEGKGVPYRGPKGDKGDTGEQGPAGPQGERGDTPIVSFRYDEETGNLYYSIENTVNGDTEVW